jgi:3-hydroxyisobutyrate dehydrogenase-like beta-hydroxyacid dehydrogenase
VSEAATQPTVAFLGTGRMGSRVAANIARARFPLIVYNRTRTKADEVAAAVGATVAATPVEAALGADVVVSMLADAPAVEATYGGEDGALAGLGSGKVAVDMGTIGPEAIADLGARVRATGAAFVEAPVSGSVATAEAGKLLIMAGGDQADVERVRPVLDAASSMVIRVGELGAGAAMKLAVNAVLFGLNEALSESLVLAERAGVDRLAAYEVFANSAVAAPAVHYRRDVFEAPGSKPAAFTIDLAIKDLALTLRLAGEVGATMPQTERNLGIMQDAAGAGRGQEDIAALAEFLRDRAEH